jgi:hypothetical protein
MLAAAARSTSEDPARVVSTEVVGSRVLYLKDVIPVSKNMTPMAIIRTRIAALPSLERSGALRRLDLILGAGSSMDALLIAFLLWIFSLIDVLEDRVEIINNTQSVIMEVEVSWKRGKFYFDVEVEITRVAFLLGHLALSG